MKYFIRILLDDITWENEFSKAFLLQCVELMDKSTFMSPLVHDSKSKEHLIKDSIGRNSYSECI